MILSHNEPYGDGGCGIYTPIITCHAMTGENLAIYPSYLAYFITGISILIFTIALTASGYYKKMITAIENEKEFLNAMLDNLEDGIIACNAEERNLGAVIVIHDITHLKQTEKLKNEFVSIVSHELRTPLTSIRGSLGLLVSGIMGEFPEKSKKLIQIANNNCERLLFAAIRAGCVAFFQKPLDISYLVQELNLNCSSPVHEAYRILILDDSQSLAEYYSLILKQADMITRAITKPLNLLKELETFQPDLILMAIYMAKQQNSPLSFIMIDIDNFKLINDTYGHPFGDVVIKKLASMLMVSLRNQDIIGRYGGEEFALILPSSNLKNSEKICNDLRLQFSNYSFITNEKKVRVTISFGISSLNHGCDFNEIVNHADQALYKAKKNGKNQVVIFSED